MRLDARRVALVTDREDGSRRYHFALYFIRGAMTLPLSIRKGKDTDGWRLWSMTLLPPIEIGIGWPP